MLIEILRRLHRWISLILAPLFLVTLVSGALLTLEPILGVGASRPRAPVDMAALAGTLARLDIAATARGLDLDPGGAIAELKFAHGTPDARIDIASGTVLPDSGPADIFAVLHDLHENLLIGVKPVVEYAAWAMVLLILAGPILAWPRLRNTIAGWHAGIGWVLFPLVLLPAGTELLRTLDVGRVHLTEPAPSSPPVTWASAISAAAQTDGPGRIESARRLPGGGISVTMGQGPDTRILIVTSHDSTIADGGRNWTKDLHDSIWAAPWSGWVNLLSASALLGLLGTGGFAWGRRRLAARRGSADAGADVLIAHASQTGTAARYAEATADALRLGGGRIATASLAALQPGDMRRYRAVLLIVSTTGEGQVPEPGRGFVLAVPRTDLKGVNFALLALGDSRYARFCRGGEAVRAALLSAGATEVLPMARCDRDPAEAWQEWLRDVTANLGIRATIAARPEADLPVALTLVDRVRLDDPAHGGTNPVWSVTLESETALDYRAGDLLLIAPGNGSPERCYSIGSAASANGRDIGLTVSLSTWIGDDGQEHHGATSSLLCRTWPKGQRTAAWLRRHPAFNLPADPNRPVILVAAGCGIAPFIGFLAEREAEGSRGVSWLIFGNRHRGADFLHGRRLQAWLQAGVLARLDTAFSRDADDGAHVQDRLVEQAAEVWAWLTARDAVLYACGRHSTLGRGLDEALTEIARSKGGLEPQAATALVAQWRADGRIRRDLFD
jgi:sulfite reductase (NADPH) flavoprotein alpha-component